MDKFVDVKWALICLLLAYSRGQRLYGLVGRVLPLSLRFFGTEQDGSELSVVLLHGL